MGKLAMSQAAKQWLTAGLLAIFVWWCTGGAAWFLARKEYYESSTWAGPLSLPWLLLGVVAAAAALLKPTGPRLAVFAGVCLIQVALVIFSW